MKLQFLFISLGLVALIGLGKSEDRIWGNVGPYDVLLHYEIVKKSSSLLQVVTFDVSFPPPLHFNNRTITAVRVTDQSSKKKGGYAQLYAGGVGFDHVTVHLKSQRGKGFSFILEIFGSR